MKLTKVEQCTWNPRNRRKAKSGGDRGLDEVSMSVNAKSPSASMWMIL